ncbi:MAG: HopJ type III effector protein [Gammaproteobacteria bacterium]|nr:HopJ type III effector protein [Gammaproteobacteria bacterium]
MNIDTLLRQLQECPESIEFTDTMAVIDDLYEFTETSFQNGDLINAAGENSGSCKLFAFGQLYKLSREQTLACFGAYYREDVMHNPQGREHQNIRNFIKTGWPGIIFSAMPLREKS